MEGSVQLEIIRQFSLNKPYQLLTFLALGGITRAPDVAYIHTQLKEARKCFFVDVVFAKRWKITKKDI